MGEMEDKIGAILNNPQMMQQIMSMAQAFGSQQKQESAPSGKSLPAISDQDLVMIQKLSGFAQKSAIDAREQALLCALEAYLSKDRITKLEKAMRAAKIAQLASSALGSGGLLSLTGR